MLTANWSRVLTKRAEIMSTGVKTCAETDINKHYIRFRKTETVHIQSKVVVLTFLSARSTEATYNRISLAPPCPGPLQLRQHKAPSWQARQNVGIAEVTWLLCTLKIASHKNKPAKPVYFTQYRNHVSPRYPNIPPRPTKKTLTTEIRRVSAGKIGGHFVKACAEKKRDAWDDSKIKK